MNGSWIFDNLIADVFLRSSALLLLGLVVSRYWWRRPDRAHRALMACLLGAAILPFGSLVVRSNNWGVLARTNVVSPTADRPAPSDRRRVSLFTWLGVKESTVTPKRPSEPTTSLTTAPTSTSDDAKAAAPMRWPTLEETLLTAWLLTSGFLLVRLVARLRASRSMLARTTENIPIQLRLAAERAGRRLELDATPDVVSSREVNSPMVWCWGRRARIVVPESSLSATNVDWAGVLTHELAHWKRRDHLSGAVSEVIACLVPFHPLVWVARRRLSDLSELACDDWAVTRGAEAVDYADSLLRLLPERRSKLPLPALGRGKLVSRIQRVVRGQSTVPEVGVGSRAWQPTIVLVMVSLLAFSQFRDTFSSSKAVATEAQEDGETSGPGVEAKVVGRVLDPAGKPAAGVDVYWFRPPFEMLAANARPKGAGTKQLPELVDQTKTDAEGRFSMKGRVPVSGQSLDQRFSFMLARTSSSGIGGCMVDRDAAENVIRLPANMPIQGRLLTPDGEPAANVEVRPTMIAKIESITPPAGWGAPSQFLHDGKTRAMPLFPRTIRTDDSGRFEINGYSRGAQATLEVTAEGYAQEEVHVSSSAGLLSAFSQLMRRQGAVDPKFEHTLEPGRTIKGTITAKADGKPVSGSRVNIVPMTRRGGRRLSTTTNEAGEYSITLGSADNYFISVYGPEGSSLLGRKDRQQPWDDPFEPVVRDFALETGKLLRGRVVDENDQPVAGASVLYQAKPQNARAQASPLDNPVITDADGRFVTVGVAGAGHLVVEAPGPKFVRDWVTIKEHGRYTDWFVHAARPVDVADEGEHEEVTLRVRRGVTLSVKVVDPAGKAVPSIGVFYRGLGAQQVHRFDRGQIFPAGRVRLPGCDPDRTYEIYFYQQRKKLGAVAKIKYSAGEETVVTLKPNGRVKGRLVRDDGSPEAGAQVITFVVTDPAFKPSPLFDRNHTVIHGNLAGEMGAMTSFNLRTDEEGHFEIDNLITGVPLFLQANPLSARRPAQQTLTLDVGEERDLGDFKLEGQR